jgi:hypothetical protein
VFDVHFDYAIGRVWVAMGTAATRKEREQTVAGKSDIRYAQYAA